MTEKSTHVLVTPGPQLVLLVTLVVTVLFTVHVQLVVLTYTMDGGPVLFCVAFTQAVAFTVWFTYTIMGGGTKVPVLNAGTVTEGQSAAHASVLLATDSPASHNPFPHTGTGCSTGDTLPSRSRVSFPNPSPCPLHIFA